MSHPGTQTNGASLEDCHANFFSLTDVCGIRWIVFREPECPSGTSKVQNGHDAVLASFAKCLDADLLAVWRRVPKRSLLETQNSLQNFSGLSAAESAAYEEKNPLSQRKELWIFWYGDKPEELFKRLVSPELKDVPDISGTWENVLPYEARTLLYKALNNLIERNLLSKDFIRLGKWFVQPFEGPEKTLQKASHLSFSFQYFVHGESIICASVDVRQHPAVRRLGPQHLASARAGSNTVQVILAPFGLSATLTGVTYKSNDVVKLLNDWSRFYPLDKNRYSCPDGQGDVITMASAVEVIVAGVKMVYPTCYVLVTDLDPPTHTSFSANSCNSAAGSSLKRNAAADSYMINHEPSPFTTSNHPLLSELSDLQTLMPTSSSMITDQAWTDGLTVNPESTLSSSEQQQHQYHQSSHNTSVDLNSSNQGPNGGNGANTLTTVDLVSAWDFTNPGRWVKKKPRPKGQKDSKNHRIRLYTKVPFHKKDGAVDELTWALDQSDLLGGGGVSVVGHGQQQHGGQTGHGGISNSIGGGGGNAGNNLKPIPSVSSKAQPSPGPGSVRTPGGPVTPIGGAPRTPKGGPGSVRTPGGPPDLMSPHAPPSNGPLTPMEMDAKMNPATPKSVPSYPVPSPFNQEKKQQQPVIKTEQQAGILQSVLTQNPNTNNMASTSSVSGTSSNMIIKSEPGGDDSNNMTNNPATSNMINNSSSNNVLINNTTSQSIISCATKRPPELPMKEYEDDLESEHLRLSDTIFDTESIRLWLNHPVKRFKPTDLRHNDPFKPLYRRQSQIEGAGPNNNAHDNAGVEAPPEVNGVAGGTVSGIVQVKTEPGTESGSHAANRLNPFGDPYEFQDGKQRDENGAKQNPADNDSLFTVKGLEPRIDDLENINIFDDSSDETEGNGVVPTPPGSNKPLNSDDPDAQFTKLKQGGQSKQITDATGGTLPNDQLAKMFPTPPSLEHPSPADGTMEVDGHLKMEPVSPLPDMTDWYSMGEDFDSQLSSNIYAPVRKLYSETCSTLQIPSDFKYKPQRRSTSGQPVNNRSACYNPNNNNNNNKAGPSHAHSTPLGTPSGMKTGMSPINSPRSHLTNTGQSSHDMASPSKPLSGGNTNNDPMKSQQQQQQDQTRIPEASSLMLNLMLSDTILNVFRDHNFDSCTICVCSNEGNIRGRDAAPYLPNFSGDDDITCQCGFSALMNRKLAHQSGLFYEDETEITGITEDLYHRKKTSLLVLDPKYNTNEDHHDQDRINLVDSIPPNLMELITEQSVIQWSEHNSLRKYANQYLRTTHQNPGISMVDHMDTNYVAFNTLEKVKAVSENGKLDEAQKGSCVHRWTLIQAAGPYCSEDIIRVMKSIQPLLNESLHVKKQRDSSTTQQKVDGPLTWRQFHRMAGSTTKGNTDDQCEPLPVPAITVGHEQDFMSMAPQAIHFWEGLSLEPYAQQRDVAYIVVAPESEFILGRVRNFIKNLSCVYEGCRLGHHVPVTKVLRDGFLKVGKKYADKLVNEQADPWFENIGESSTSMLLKLYSLVCRQYLLPLLHQLPMDRSLIESALNAQKQVLVEKTPCPSPMPPPSMTNSGDYMLGNSMNSLSPGVPSSGPNKGPGGAEEDLLGKENINATNDTNDDCNTEPPAIVVYMVDPFSFGPASDNCDTMRLTTLGLLRSFLSIIPQLGDTLKNNITLQMISLDSIMELGQSQYHSRMPSVMRGLAFSTFSQARRPLQHLRDCKTLTGFGPASSSEKYLKVESEKAKFVRPLHSPAFILAPASLRKKAGSDSEAFGSTSERSSVLFVNYCLSEDQHWLLASCCDDRGELVKTMTINIEIPNKTRRKKASARRVGLRKLMDWILSVMSMSLVPWRLVIGRIGRIGHGELRGWSVLLSRKSLKKDSKKLRDLCNWKSEVPCILSACLVSMEPDSHLRLMSDQYTPDERWSSANQLSTPKDASCTHVLVFPTSAKAQSSQKEFNDHRDETNEDVGDIFGNLEFDMDPNDNDLLGGELDNLDLFNDAGDDNLGGFGQDEGGPDPNGRNDLTRGTNSPSDQNKQSGSDRFLYDQEEADERIEILQQPLALGYMVSTAKTGPMPRWFWASCPHLEKTSPVFLKSALHINVASLMHGGDDGFAPNSSSGRVHSLDSNYTADVLRYVLEGYNALSWLSLDFENHDRKSCLPIHVQVLLQLYNSLAALV